MLQRLKNLIAPRARTGVLAAPPPWLFDSLGAQGTETGVSVGPETALHSPAVYASVKAIAETVAMLPLKLYRRGPDGQRGEAADHPMAFLLSDAPNAVQTAFDFRVGMQTDALLRGNAFAYVHRAGGQIAELLPIPAGAVAVDYDEANLPVYRVTMADGAQRVFTRDHVVHVKTLSARDPYVGESPVRLAARAIALDIAMTAHAGALFGRGARPSGMLSTEQTLGEESVKRLKDAFDSAYQGLTGAGKTVVLEQGLKFDQLTMTSVDAQLLELRRHQVGEIARVFRVPLPLLQDLERATHSNAEEMSRQFMTYTLRPWLRAWEQALARTLFTPAERRELYFEFDTADFVKADIAARFDAYTRAITNGFMSPNEVRQLENRPPYEGGDEFWMPSNIEAANRARLNEGVAAMQAHLNKPRAARAAYRR